MIGFCSKDISNKSLKNIKIPETVKAKIKKFSHKKAKQTFQQTKLIVIIITIITIKIIIIVIIV